MVACVPSTCQFQRYQYELIQSSPGRVPACTRASGNYADLQVLSMNLGIGNVSGVPARIVPIAVTKASVQRCEVRNALGQASSKSQGHSCDRTRLCPGSTTMRYSFAGLLFAHVRVVDTDDYSSWWADW